MSIDLDDVNLIVLATDFVNQGDKVNPCIVDSVEEWGEDLKINYSWERGSSEWVVSPVNLMAWAWNNPKVV